MHTLNDEVQQDTSRALSNIASNEDNHKTMYTQGALTAMFKLSESHLDITQRYAAMGIRFLASDPEVRVMIVDDNKIAPFTGIAHSPLLEFRRTAGVSMASFLHESNSAHMLRQIVYLLYSPYA